MSAPLQQLLSLMARLRSKDGGCPWDVEQTFATIAPHTLEEAYEVADAIERNDMGALKEELGDLLLQVVFHSQMANEEGLFAFDDVAQAICDKLVSRHPHVFGGAKVESAEAQAEAWENIKREEKLRKNPDDTVSLLDGVTLALPALLRAIKLQKRAAKVGFDWPSVDEVFDKLHEELGELRQAIQLKDAPSMTEEMGDLLFVVCNISRKLGIDPETALRQANIKFDRRFRHIERTLNTQQRRFEDSSLQELDELWDQAKMLEKMEPPHAA